MRNFLGLADGSAPYTTQNASGATSGPFYDGAVFHRVIRGFMIQSGDPTATARSGSGYEFSDQSHPELRFDRLPAGHDQCRAGYQRFPVLHHCRSAAAPGRRHTIFREVVDPDSREVVDVIADTPTDRSDRPLEPVTISKITIE